MVLWKKTAIEFLEKRNLNDFWKSLGTIWKDIDKEEKLDAFNFLYTGGHWKKFLDLFIEELDSQQPVLPWALAFSIIEKRKFHLPKDHQEFLTMLFRSKKVDVPADPQATDFIQSLKLKEKYIFLAQIQKKRQELLESARIAKSERLFEQQIQYLTELKKLFPNDVSVKKNIHQRQRTDAEKVLAKPRLHIPHVSEKQIAEQKQNEKFVEQLKIQAQKISQTKPGAKIDLAFMFAQMGYAKTGLDFLRTSDDKCRSSWLLFDFLLQSKQYLSLLDHCEIMKISISGEPEALFAISYFEALTYWELGEQQKAVKLMRSISKAKPFFRSANEILSFWLEEVN